MEYGGLGYSGEVDNGSHFKYVLVEDGLYYIVAVDSCSSGGSGSHQGKEILPFHGIIHTHTGNSQTNPKTVVIIQQQMGLRRV